MTFLRHLWAFSRPHTIIGTTLSVSALAVIAWDHTQFTANPLQAISGLLLALVSCWGANIYIVGLNQLSDVEIDKINKPGLPLASGAITIRGGWIIIFSALAVSIITALLQSAWLMITVFGSLLLGTLYSLPPVRLKRFHFWAAFCILAVRGLLVNIFLFLHFQHIYGTTQGLPLKIILLTVFMFGQSVVIAWFKDIPDMRGDKRFSIGSLSLRVGAERVFSWGKTIIIGGYLLLAVFAVAGLPGVEPWSMAIAHLLLALWFWLRGKSLQAENPKEMTAFYQFVWKLFFIEYIVFTLVCLAA